MQQQTAKGSGAESTKVSATPTSLIWQSYKAALLRKDEPVAIERLLAYLKLWQEAVDGGQGSSSGPMLSSSGDRFGLLRPSIAFGASCEGWKLQSATPPDLLKALLSHADKLSSLMQAETESSTSTGGADETTPTKAMPIEEIVSSVLQLSRVLNGIASCYSNHYDLVKSKPIAPVMKLALNCYQLVCAHRNLTDLLDGMCYLTAFLHSMVDPRKVWQRQFHRDRIDLRPPSTIPALPGRETQDLFELVFQGREERGVVSPQEDALRLEMVHLLGAAISNSTENRLKVVELFSLVLSLLEPREACGPLQALALKLLVQLVHTLHYCIPKEQQTSVDVEVVLIKLLNTMSPRKQNEAGELIPPSLNYTILLLDTIPLLVHPPSDAGSGEELKELLVIVGCYEKLLEVMNLLSRADESSCTTEERKQLVMAVFAALTSIMADSPAAKESFEGRQGYSTLKRAVEVLVLPDQEILQAALDMVVEGSFAYLEEAHTIYNTSCVGMLLQWLPSLPGPLQLWLAPRLQRLCSFGLHNRQKCCTAGLVRVATQVLVASQERGKELSIMAEDWVVSLVEVLGTHSILAAELKGIFEALRPLQGNELPTYYYKLLRTLRSMALKTSDGTQPLYYFDLRQTGSHIFIPSLYQWPSSSASFTFFTWVNLDHQPLPAAKGSKVGFSHPSKFSLHSTQPVCSQKRRMLYSFYSPADVGFEAFFNDSLELVVATATKKEFLTMTLKGNPVLPLVWHCVCVVFSGSRRPWGASRSEVSVYIDGVCKRHECMKAQYISEAMTCYVGSAPHVRDLDPFEEASIASSSLEEHSLFSPEMKVSMETLVHSTPHNKQTAMWGHRVHMGGQLGPVCLFSEALSPAAVRLLHAKGPNNLALFQPKFPETHELAPKLFLYYHPKACKEGVCFDVADRKSVV